MVDQTEMNGAAPRASASTLARHAIELSELQFELLVADVRAAARGARTGLLLLLLAMGPLIAAAPVLLLAAAAWLETAAGLSRELSLLVTGLAALATSGLFVALGWRALRGGAGKLGRSRDEFRRNLHWAKQMLSSGHAPPKSTGAPNPDPRAPKRAW